MRDILQMAALVAHRGWRTTALRLDWNGTAPIDSLLSPFFLASRPRKFYMHRGRCCKSRAILRSNIANKPIDYKTSMRRARVVPVEQPRRGVARDPAMSG
jgi:hypothetical protein